MPLCHGSSSVIYGACRPDHDNSSASSTLFVHHQGIDATYWHDGRREVKCRAIGDKISRVCQRNAAARRNEMARVPRASSRSSFLTSLCCCGVNLLRPGSCRNEVAISVVINQVFLLSRVSSSAMFCDSACYLPIISRNAESGSRHDQMTGGGLPCEEFCGDGGLDVASRGHYWHYQRGGAIKVCVLPNRQKMSGPMTDDGGNEAAVLKPCISFCISCAHYYIPSISAKEAS